MNIGLDIYPTKLDTYAISSFNDLFSGIASAILFFKHDESQLYDRLCLSEEPKKYTVINSNRVLFRCYRFCFGISSAPGIL